MATAYILTAKELKSLGNLTAEELLVDEKMESIVGIIQALIKPSGKTVEEAVIRESFIQNGQGSLLNVYSSNDQLVIRLGQEEYQIDTNVIQLSGALNQQNVKSYKVEVQIGGKDFFAKDTLLFYVSPLIPDDMTEIEFIKSVQKGEVKDAWFKAPIGSTLPEGYYLVTTLVGGEKSDVLTVRLNDDETAKALEVRVPKGKFIVDDTLYAQNHGIYIPKRRGGASSLNVGLEKGGQIMSNKPEDDNYAFSYVDGEVYAFTGFGLVGDKGSVYTNVTTSENKSYNVWCPAGVPNNVGDPNTVINMRCTITQKTEKNKETKKDELVDVVSFSRVADTVEPETKVETTVAGKKTAKK